MSCHRCGGTLPDCPDCDGAGEIAQHRCPFVDARGAADALQSYWDFTEQGVLPAPGAMEDQAAWWVEGLRAVQIERGRIEKAQRELASGS